MEPLHSAINKEVSGIFKYIIQWVKARFNKEPRTTSKETEQNNKFAESYNDPEGINIYAMAANKLAGVVVNESKAGVQGTGKRAEALGELLTSFTQRKWHSATADIAGNGGIVIIPNYVGGVIGEDVIPQNRVVVNRQHNGVWQDVVVIVDMQRIKDQTYYLLRNMVINGGVYTESYKAVQGDVIGEEVPIDTVPAWVGIRPLTPTGKGIAMDRLPLAFAGCPTSDRNMNFTKGVPITYGQDEVISNIKSILRDFMTEAKNKRAFIGIDERMSATTYDNNGKATGESIPESGVFRLLPGISTGQEFFKVFDPQLRDSSYIQILDYWFKMLERGIGVSEGFFTQPKAAAVTATEVKAKNYDTFITQSAFRTMWEHALTDLVYAYNVLMNYYGMNPPGDYELVFDWSYDLIENTDVAFNQQMQAESIGVIGKDELRQWLRPSESAEEAARRIAEIEAQYPTVSMEV